MGNTQGRAPDETRAYLLPTDLARDRFYLSGSWKNTNDDMELSSVPGSISLRFYARNVFLVAGTSGDPIELTIRVDDKPAGKTIINGFQLYQVYNSTSGYREHKIELIPAAPGLMTYTFTFG